MPRKTTHVVPQGDKWAVKSGGAQKAHRVTTTQREAIQVATQVSKNKGGELLIHRSDGRIRDARSHGNDPCPPRDKK